mgnify:CR=1 FL=1
MLVTHLVSVMLSMPSLPIRRPRLIIITWIIILVLLYPFFSSLESLISASQESLLPRESESSVADSLLNRFSGGGSYDILYITGINISDPVTSLRVSELIESLAYRNSMSYIAGFPQLVLQTYRSIYNISTIAINSSIIAIEKIDRLIDRLEGNLSYTIEGFKNLSAYISKTMDLLAAVDSNYTIGVDSAINISKNLEAYREGLRILDRKYSETYSQASMYSRSVATLITGIIYNTTNRNNLAALYSFLWWQAARTIYYYNTSGSEYSIYTNLTSIDPRLSPLPRDLAETIYNRFRSLYEKGLVPDIAISNITSEILMPQAIKTYFQDVDERSVRIIVMVVERGWVEAYSARGQCLYCTLEPPRGGGQEHIASQLNLLTTVMSIGSRASELVNEKGMGYVEDIIYLEIMGAGVSSSAARELASMIVSGRIDAAKVASIVVGETSRSGLLDIRLAPYVVEILETIDPEARGTIWASTSTAERALAILVSRIGGVDLDLASRIVELGLRNASRSDFAKELRLYISRAAENMSMGLIASQDLYGILEKYDPEARGLLRSGDSLINASLELFILSANRTGYGDLTRGIPLDLLEKIAVGQDPVLLAKSYFLNISVGRISSGLTDTSGYKINSTTLREVVEYIVNTYPNTSRDRVYEYYRKIIASSIEESSQEIGGFETLVRSLADLIASKSMDAYLGRISTAKAINDTSSEIFSKVFGSVLKTASGRIAGYSNTSFIVIYTPAGNNSYESSKNFAKIVREAIGRFYPNTSILWSGGIAIGEDLRRSSVEDVARISRVSEILVFVVLLAILGSLVAVILPYVGIVLGVVVGGGVAYFIASAGAAEMLSLTRTLIYVIPLGLGSDYAAYLVYRFREEYSRLRDPRLAAEESLRRAGPAIVASALTVMAGFGSLALGWEFPLFRSLGVFMPLVVGVTALSCLTLVPSILSIAGGFRLFWWGFGRGIKGSFRPSSLSYRISRLGPAIPVVFMVISISSLAVYPSIQASHDLRLFLPSNAPSIAALDAIASDIGYGQVFPTYVVIVSGHDMRIDDLYRVEELSYKISEIPGVKSVEGPTRPFGDAINITSKILEDPVVSRYISGNMAYLRIILEPNPFSGDAISIVEEIRNLSRIWGSRYGYTIYIGGTTSSSGELDKLVNGIFWQRVLPFSIASMILIFTIVFRGFIAAVIAVSLVILSSLISMVLTGFIFNRIFSTPVIWFLPQVVFTAMLGVGMDYNSFYMARAREVCITVGECNARGSSIASGAVGRLIIGLAFVVAAAFGSLMLSSSTGLREIGLSLLVSAMMISTASSYLVAPPLLSILGRRAWKII